MPYVKSFNRLVSEKRDYSDEVALSIPRQKSHKKLWSHLSKRVRMHKWSSKKELEAKLHEEWQKIDPTTCNNLVNNMQKRIKAVIKAKGGHTKYWLLLLMFTPLFLTFKYISLNHNFDFSLVLHNFGQGYIYIYIYIYGYLCVSLYVCLWRGRQRRDLTFGIFDRCQSVRGAPLSTLERRLHKEVCPQKPVWPEDKDEES